MREQTKLEQILARQRQKLDEVFKKKKKHQSNLIFYLFRRIMFVQYLVTIVHIQMNLNLFINEFVNNKNKKNDYYFV